MVRFVGTPSSDSLLNKFKTHLECAERLAKTITNWYRSHCSRLSRLDIPIDGEMTVIITENRNIFESSPEPQSRQSVCATYEDFIPLELRDLHLIVNEEIILTAFVVSENPARIHCLDPCFTLVSFLARDPFQGAINEVGIRCLFTYEQWDRIFNAVEKYLNNKPSKEAGKLFQQKTGV